MNLQLSNLCRVSESRRDREVRNALDTLPSGLDKTYIRILGLIYGQSNYMRTLAFKTFRWVMYAQRPLTTAELQHALATEDLCRPGGTLELDEIAVILGACANLIAGESQANHWESIIRPIHYSVQEFFTGAHTDTDQGCNLDNLPDPCRVHTELATTCMLYLQATLSDQHPCKYQYELQERVESFPFLWYAAQFFDYHLLRCGSFSEGLVKQTTAFLYQPNSFLAAVLQLRAISHRAGVLQAPSIFRDFDSHNWTVDMSTLVYATELYNIRNLHTGWKDLQPPPYALHRACSAGLVNVVSRLLADVVDVDEKDTNGLKPVYHASNRGDLSILGMLLSRGANVCARGGYFGNALQAASCKGHEKIVELLLSKGADLNAQGGFYGNALQAASYGGHEKIIELLISKGANLNALGGFYGNALQAALSGGYKEVVELLFSKGADLNAQGGAYGNALQAASLGGYEAAVELLLSKGADLNAQGGYYGNALQAASFGGYGAAVELLLSNGASLNAQGGRYGNALQAASCGGHEKIVELLLSKGADLNAQGGYYGNALQAASLGGHKKIVKLLLSKGAVDA